MNKFQLIGETLGYPLKAVCELSNEVENVISENEKFIVQYYGFNFVSYQHTLEEDIKWLKETYQMPKGYTGFISEAFMSINVFVFISNITMRYLSNR